VDGERAEVYGNIEIGAREGFDQGDADEEVARRDEARDHDVFSEEGDDDGAAAEDDGSGEIEV
jgi:hypothetical protein